MEFFEYLSPSRIEKNPADFEVGQLYHQVHFYSEQNQADISDYQIAIVGVKDERGARENKGVAVASDYVRQYLYELTHYDRFPNVIDMGDIIQGAEKEDTYFAVRMLVQELVKKGVVPLIIGGGQDLTYANYLAYQQLEQTVNLVTIDNRFDFGNEDDSLDSSNYLTKIILSEPNVLFNFSHIGFQSHYAKQQDLELMRSLYFDYERLGSVVADMTKVEPLVRNADMLSVDMSAIRQSEAPGNAYATPNGLYGDDICQLMKYAGMSDKLSSLGIYELNPTLDSRNQTVQLVAQMIWYFIDGFSNRKGDYPIGTKASYAKYSVSLQEGKHDVIFYKSDKTERWWIDVPYPNATKSKYERHLLVPCSYEDYSKACQDELPNIWWKTYQKLV